ncbi:cutinase transcription factor 1 alpha [Botrytis cinerea]
MNPSTGLQFAPEHQQHHSEKGCRGKHDPSHNKAEDMSTKPTSLPCRRTFRRNEDPGQAEHAGCAIQEECDATQDLTEFHAQIVKHSSWTAIYLRERRTRAGKEHPPEEGSPPINRQYSDQDLSEICPSNLCLVFLHKYRVKRRGHFDENGDGEEEKNDDDELPRPVASNHDDFASLILQAGDHIKQQPDSTKQYVKLINPPISSSAIENPGKVAYLQEKSSLAMLMKDYYGTTDAVHYPLPEDAANQHMATKMNPEEMDILAKRGALQLPPRDLCEELIDAYFKWVAPVIPIINKSWFMQRWHDLDNQPPLLLMQAILLAGSRRAKALYDADYEEDRVVIVQALILLGWYWEEPGVVTKNVFYWNGLATTIAQGFGMHRNPSGSRLSPADKRLWKRIWWTLYIRDRSVATALGRPAHINLEDSDLEMIREEDFVDDHTEPEDEIQVQFFLQYVKICEIMDDILFQHYSLQSKKHGINSLILQQCDQALNEWFQNCPRQIRWNSSNNNFWSSYLYSIYHTTRCLLYRAYLPSVKSSSELHEKLNISQHPAFQSASAITSVAENMIARNELRRAPPFLIYSLLSALIMHVYELQIYLPSTNSDARKRVLICMSALDKLSDVWLVAKMVRGLFETILKAAGFENHTLEGTKRFKKIGEHKVPVFSFIEDPLSASQSARESKEDSLPLTHSLLAHQKATLNFVSGKGTRISNEGGTSISNNDDFSPTSISSLPPVQHQPAPPIHGGTDFVSGNLWPTTVMPNPTQETAQYQDPNFPGSMNYLSPDPMAYWIQPDFQQMIPATLDVADWLAPTV